MSIYRQFGIEPIINACGTLTRLGGALMPDAVIEAMKLAAQSSVPLDDLHAAAARQIARWTGAESGLVTAGAAAGLTLGSAALLARADVARINQLPDTSNIPHEFLIAADQRNGYDHAVRAAGARLIEVGMNERVAGSGVRGVELADYEEKLGERSAGVLYVYREGAEPSLRAVVEWAHERGLPVLVDAAAELTRRRNLRAIPATGADLVAFSGGKAIRGPQATGVLCGQRALIESAALQMLDLDVERADWNPPTDFIDPARWPKLPRQGLGRGFKVAKEQIVGLLVALELFAQESEEEILSADQSRHERLIQGLADHAIEATLGFADGDGPGPILVPLPVGAHPQTIRSALRAGRPPVHARCTEDGRQLVLHLACVRPEQDHLLIDRVAETLTRCRGR